MILADNETKVDLLNNEAIATTIIGLLRAKPEHPVTIGVHGDWGAGKSSVLEMIEAGFANTDDVLCLKFNGWRFQGFEDAKIALIEGIVTGLVEKRPALTKAAAAVKDVFSRIDWLKVAKRAGGLAMTAFTGIPTPDQIGAIIGSLEALVADPAKIATKENLTTAVDEVKAVLKPGESKNVPEEVEAFRKAFDRLLKDAGIRQLVVLIDDLDRCLPDTAIETLEAIRLFVFTARTAFVVAADEAMIEYAVRKHFPDLPDSTGPRDYARNYLEKLIQVPFRIPALGETETRIYVTLLLAGAEIGEDDADYAKLIGVAREKLKRPWTSGGLDSATIKTALGKQAEKANNALALSDQIGPILASGAKGNPRQIKRFLNTLLLRERTATARGFGDDIKLPVLAKLMLAERFIPRLFEQIAFVAAVHPHGFCEDLDALEKHLATADGKEPQAGERKGPKSVEPVSVPDSAVLAEWKSSETICDWACLSPKLSGIDLRPYLFVTKDKKDYFGPVSVLGHLAGVVEKLFGGKMTVQSYEAELKQLVQPEAEKVFEAVRTKIMSTGAFDIKPPGIDGLVVLVKAQPGLQTRLMDFLEALPSGKCGPWAVSGWQGVIKDVECAARLTKLLGDWSKATNNPGLKASAEAALKDVKGAR
ncbi:P-loop NTPase fold protein [Pandoraea sp. XJJ-1]|uniref:Qat anti-phage system ATPase QatA n=1 Tax=Burkholderiaceae TaxID=119060 RepID=UPI000DABB484|nr:MULTISPECIES: Qat anti-phage system ATPase QatA [Burkholderiaceae]AZU56127.1 NTPase KAP [Ralstonia solanacearum]MCK4136071.1 NTPase KAP [Ralstonia pseudosolanacearum]QVX41854.1 NTPase KAP [Ralstonia solanacearum]QWQ10875.1 KAP family NTPase [Ralstonia solanacearum]RAA14260.1 NTPase KAP [Ralstonia pseudosolanacearum]